MTLRLVKIALVLGIALIYVLTVFNNLTDYNANFQLVRHVLMMDSTLPDNGGLWRAINQPALHHTFYITIILWEVATTILCVWGGLRLVRAFRRDAQAFHAASNVAVGGLTLGLLMWLLAFLGVGGEWFLMWQSKAWNGQEAAFRMFTVVGIVLLVVLQRDSGD